MDDLSVSSIPVIKKVLLQKALRGDFNSIRMITEIEEKPDPQGGGLVIWKRGNGSGGHVGFIVGVDGPELRTIEGNVANMVNGINKQGVWYKQRNWKVFIARFYVLGFVRWGGGAVINPNFRR